MSIYANSFQYEVNSEIIAKKISYLEILTKVQEYTSQNQQNLINDISNIEISNYNRNNELVVRLKLTIEEFLREGNLNCDEISSRAELVDKLVDSMVFYDLLTPYILDDDFILENKIEEINGNSWDEIYVTDKNGTHLIKDKFPSLKCAIHTLTALATKLNKTLNEATPIFLGEIRKNIRIACVTTPIVDEDKGVQFSIRIVSLKDLKRANLINNGTYSEEELILLETCVSHGVNVLFAGATNSGKTATMSYLLSNLAQDDRKRIATIEIDAREFNLSKYDENGRVKNNVFSWRTRESQDKAQNINSDNLIELALRFSPMIIAMGEMRNKEAMMACEIATTGHTVLTTVHADNASDGYDRIVMLCKKAGLGYSDETLYKLALKAFPIIVFQKRFVDGSRKCMEIVEGIEYKNGEVVTKSLYRFHINSSSETNILGEHKVHNIISNKLIERMIENGASEQEINKIKG